jgi:rhamnosyltransferase
MIFPAKPISFPPPVAAVVVTYHPGAEVLENLRCLRRQANTVIVVDNATSGNSASLIEEIGQMPGIKLIRNDANLGIATALNIGIRHALESGAAWIATFDQDTAVADDYFKLLFEGYDVCPQKDTVGMIVPGGWVETRATARRKSSSDLIWSFVRDSMNSGSLIKAEILSQTGLFDDALFIDYVDMDFCLRLQKCRFKILSATTVLLEHELGEKQTRTLLGIKLSFRIHTAWRYYYIFRNRLLLHRRYLTFAPGWVLHDAGWLIMELGRMILLEHGRGAKLRAVFQGFKDGLRGRQGRHPEFPSRRQ